MRCIYLFVVFILMSCQIKQKNKIIVDNLINTEATPSGIEQDSLFELDIRLEENFIYIKAPKEFNFTLPDNSAKTEPTKFDDFNADNKEDVMVYLGACGTGGCMYAVFLKEYENYYKLVFMDYLKGAQFEKEKNGLISIKSFEEVESFDPSKLYVTKFKFNQTKYIYESDTTYIQIDR